MLPVWQKTVAPFVESGKLVVVGVVQEQHQARAELYAQWRKLDWPIFVDSLNLLDVAAVPIPVALDASGVVRHASILPGELERAFIDADYLTTSKAGPAHASSLPDLKVLRDLAERSQTARAWRELGDAEFLYGGADGVARAVKAYERAVGMDPTDGRAHFRLGVAFRRRYESSLRQAGDAQSAVDHWEQALSIDPNQYIWRRRIQQYGPRLDKPYNFYYWVERARSEITARGETPVPLGVEPSGSEIASPAKRRRSTGGHADRKEPAHQPGTQAPVCDSRNERIHRDRDGFVRIEPVLTPSRVQPGRRVRVRVTFRLNEKTHPYWNNEAKDLAVCLDLPNTVTSGEGRWTFPNPKQAETRETRSLEFEVAVAKDAAAGIRKLPGYALYYVCEGKGGKCHYVRQDFNVALTIDPAAPSL